MKLARIVIAGFRGVRERLELNIPDGFLVLTGRNGSGKSTVFDAVEYGMTGTLSRFEKRTEKGESIHDYLWWRGERQPEARLVELTFAKDSGERFSFKRGPDENSLDVTAALRSEFCDSNAPSSDWASALVRTMLLRDETIAALSLDLGETERFQFVESALGVLASERRGSRVDAAVALIRSRREKAEASYATARDQVLTTTAELARIRESTTSSDVAAAALDVLRAEFGIDGTDPSIIEAQLSALRSRLKQVELAAHDLLEATRHRADLERQAGEPRTVSAMAELAELETRIPVAREALKNLDDDIAQAGERAKQRAAFAQLASLGEQLWHDGRCPLCSSAVHEEQFQAQVERLKREAGEESTRHAAMVTARVKTTSELAEMQDRILRVRQLLAALDEAIKRSDAALVELRTQINAATGLDDVSHEAVTSWLANLGVTLRRVEQAAVDLVTARLVDRASETERELEAMKKEADDLGRQVQKLKAGEDSLTDLRSAIRSVTKEIVDERLASAEPLLVDLYRRLRPHADWREVSYRIRGELRKFLSFSVGDGINPSFVFSAGQRRAAGLAFLLAVHLARTWCKLDTLMLDDPVQHIDDFRALHLVEVLSAIRKSGRQIICSAEDPALADLLVRRLQVAPLAGGARIELRYDATRGVVIASEKSVYALPQDVLQTA